MNVIVFLLSFIFVNDLYTYCVSVTTVEDMSVDHKIAKYLSEYNFKRWLFTGVGIGSGVSLISFVTYQYSKKS